MLGATLRVKSRMADLCRADSSVPTLVLDINGWFIEAMFALPLHTLSWVTDMALLTEGARAPMKSINIALLTEGGSGSDEIYKHGLYEPAVDVKY